MATQQTFAFLNPPVPAAPLVTKEECVAEPILPSPPDSRDTVLQRLRVRAGCISTIDDSHHTNQFSTGSSAIDSLLPRGGLKVDAITEWLAASDGCGAGVFSLIAAAAQLRAHRGPLVIVDLGEVFYPPAAVALGVPAERMILVRPRKHADLVWSIDQALRCESVAAVWANVGSRLDDRDARRFQLAAETGGTPALLARPAAVRGRPSFADVRFHVRAQPQQRDCFTISLDRCRGGALSNQVTVSIDDQANIQRVSTPVRHETAALHLATELAHPTAAQPVRRRRHA